MKCIITISFFVLSCSLCFGQSASFAWTKLFIGAGQHIPYAVATDKWGNAYTTGHFEGTVDFDPGPGVYNLTTPNLHDIFITKLDAIGKFLWAKQIVDAVESYKVAVDTFGNVFITGCFFNTIDADPGPGIQYMSSTAGGSGTSTFLIKLSTDGNFIWAKQFDGYSSLSSVATDDSGSVYLNGLFGATIDLDPGPGTHTVVSTATRPVGFIVKLNSSGNFIWGNKIGGEGNLVAIDKEKNVYISGILFGKQDLDPGSSDYFLSSVPLTESDIFVCKLNSSGHFVWAKQMGGTNTDYPTGIAVDKLGNVITTGMFYLKADFDPSSATKELSTSLGLKSGFLSKLDKNGDYCWAKKIDNGKSVAVDIAVDTFCEIYLTGYFKGKLDFYSDTESGAFPTITLDAIGTDIFISMINKDGNYLWVKQLKSTSSTTGSLSRAITVDKSGWSIYTVGYFVDKVDFDPGLPSYTLTATGGEQLFVHKLLRCNINTSIKESACIQYTSPSGKYIWTKSGVYKDAIALPTGCDSNLDINLTIKSVDISVKLTPPILSANASPATYQWFNCDSPKVILNTSKDFSAIKNGKYAVIVTQGGCSDTSSCYFVKGTSIFEHPKDQIKIYPNPTERDLYIKYHKPVYISMSDLLGKEIIRTNNTGKIDLSELLNGIYILKMYDQETNELLITDKIIKIE